MEEVEKFEIDRSNIKLYTSDENIIDLVTKQFKYIGRSSAILLIKKILKNETKIHYNSFKSKNNKKFINRNKTRLDDDGYINNDELIKLRREIFGLCAELGKDIPQYGEENDHDFEVKRVDGNDCYVINKSHSYKKFRKLVCDEGGKVYFKYNFNNGDNSINTPKNTDMLQRCNIQILTKNIKFDYPVEYKYVCPECFHESLFKVYEVVSTNNKIKCDGIKEEVGSDGVVKFKKCKTTLTPDKQDSRTKDCYYYKISYDDDDGTKKVVDCISFEKYEPGYFECVLFKIKNPMGTESYQLIDVKPFPSNELTLPEKVDGENYIFKLIESFDDFIEKQTGVKIFGLLPFKIAIIFQALSSYLGYSLNYNILFCGAKGSGKTTVVTNYSYLLYNNQHLSSDGASISVPALRGCNTSISLLGKDMSIMSMGYLGEYKSIHIDETGDKLELVEALKTFLNSANYQYNKQGGDPISKKRIAHINLTENLTPSHLRSNREAIMKEYNKLIVIGEEEKDPWDDSWDLYLPLHEYNNPYLRRAIKYKQDLDRQNEVSYITGKSTPLIDRFPFYFYFTNEKDNKILDDITQRMTSKSRIVEFSELLKVLKTNSIGDFLNSLKKYKISKSDRDNYVKVNDILKSYNLELNQRNKMMYYEIATFSRIINKRFDIINDDLDIVRYIIENTNCKVDVVDTVDFKIKGPINNEVDREIDLQIERDTKILEDNELDDSDISEGGLYKYEK